MTDPKPEKRRRGWAFWALGSVGILAIVYPLSIGPMAAIVMLPDEALPFVEVFHWFYTPIYWLAGRHEFGREVLWWYIDLFAPPEFWRA